MKTACVRSSPLCSIALIFCTDYFDVLVVHHQIAQYDSAFFKIGGHLREHVEELSFPGDNAEH